LIDPSGISIMVLGGAKARARMLAGALVLLAVVSSAHAGSSKPVECLSVADPVICLVDVAARQATNGVRHSDSADVYATLLSTLVSVDYRRDELFIASRKIDRSSAPPLSRWELELAERLYRAHFGLAKSDESALDEFRVLAQSTRQHLKGTDFVSFVLGACDMQQGPHEELVIAFDDVLEKHCRIDPGEIASLNAAIPGMTPLLLPLVLAYQKDTANFEQSVRQSLLVLRSIEISLLEKSKDRKARKALEYMAFFGHYLNAQALAEVGEMQRAELAAAAAHAHLKLVRKGMSVMAYLPLELQLAQLAVKLDQIDQANLTMKSVLARWAKAGKGSLSDRIAVLMGCVDILSASERRRESSGAT